MPPEVEVKSKAWLKVPATEEGTVGLRLASSLPARDGEVIGSVTNIPYRGSVHNHVADNLGDSWFVSKE
ncbi:hypothetical protein N7541_005544 [Penicillium brevicompactum]|uniref:Uncharacterized protein n=1 Tax=Penicillium brevicompactum TaxID=5074 RepID=A0A9W9R6F9_PENBR|nr:hypothetical protein N7541_005544 [Penicillium brevicompactum]